MGKKTLWAICGFNILASVVAIGWVTRPYWQPRPKPSFELAQPPAKDSEAAWTEFASASTYDGAKRALSGIPASEERQAKLGAFLGAGQPSANVDGSALAAARRAAAIAFWGESIESGSADDAWLRGLALDRSRSVLEREAALRAVVLAAHRRHKASQSDGTDDWRGSLAAYLEQSDFGRGTSVEGLALQAQSFALVEKIAPVNRSALVERIGLLLLPQNGAGESVIVTALEVARGLGAGELLGAARLIARHPKSDACQQAAFAFLAELGTAEDLSWISGYAPMTANLQLAASNTRAVLAAKLASEAAKQSAVVSDR